VLPREPEEFRYNIKLGKDILEHIKRNRSKRLKVITLVREPISRAVSNLFENWQYHFQDINQVDSIKLENYLLTSDNEYDYTLGWFDFEFLETTNFDIYQHPFDKGRGYQIYSSSYGDILCIKLEALNKVSQVAFQEFLGFTPDIQVKNSSQGKATKNQFAQLRENLKLSKDKLEQLYDSKYITHFYTPKEVERFIEKWAKK
jgi:hypothetical protein